MTWCRERRRQKRKISADCGCARELRRIVTGGGDNPARFITDDGDKPRWPVNPVGAGSGGEIAIASDQKNEPARATDRCEPPGDSGARRVIIIAIDDGGARRQAPKDWIGPRNAPPVGQEGEREGRIRRAAGPFERGGGPC